MFKSHYTTGTLKCGPQTSSFPKNKVTRKLPKTNVGTLADGKSKAGPKRYNDSTPTRSSKSGAVFPSGAGKGKTAYPSKNGKSQTSKASPGKRGIPVRDRFRKSGASG